VARIAPSRETLIALFAKSGNSCAFPGCTHELITSRNLFVGQICHIEAANVGGPRFNPNMTDEERRACGNLVLLCYKHHRETDDVTFFDVATLIQMKQSHEANRGEKPFKVNEAFLHRLEVEMKCYWDGVSNANQHLHIATEFAIQLRVGIPATEQFGELGKCVGRIRQLLEYLADCDSTLNEEIRSFLRRLGYDVAVYDAVPYFENPFFNRNWLMHALASNNAVTDLIVVLKQSEVRFLEEYVKTHPADSNAIATLETAKSELQSMAVSAGYAD
jgi:hypothetical protein